MKLVICNNTKENFIWEPEKMNVKYHKITSRTSIFQNFTCFFVVVVVVVVVVLFSQFL